MPCDAGSGVRQHAGAQLQLMEEQMEKRMGILEGKMSGVSELAAEQDRRIRATAVQVEKRMKEHWRLEDWAIKCGYHRDGEYA